VVEEKFVEKRREPSFSISRREEEAERAQCPTSNAEIGTAGADAPLPWRSLSAETDARKDQEGRVVFPSPRPEGGKLQNSNPNVFQRT
jgi:hypothetical protein